MPPLSLIHDPSVTARVVHLRKMAGLSQKQFGALIGYNDQYIGLLERAKRPFPLTSLHIVIQNIRLHGIMTDIDWILTGNGTPPYVDPTFHQKIETLAEETLEDPTIQFARHALALTKIYGGGTSLWVPDDAYAPHINPNEFLIAARFPAKEFAPSPTRIYLIKILDQWVPTRLHQSKSMAETGIFDITSLHRLISGRIEMHHQSLEYIYPVVSVMRPYIKPSLPRPLLQALSSPAASHADQSGKAADITTATGII